MLGLVMVLIVTQTVLIGVLLWRFRRFEHAATTLTKQHLILAGRLQLLEEQVGTHGSR